MLQFLFYTCFNFVLVTSIYWYNKYVMHINFAIRTYVVHMFFTQ